MKVVIIGAGLSARHLAHLITSVEDLPPVELTRPGLEIDFYRDGSGKQKAQWKRETHGRKLK